MAKAPVPGAVKTRLVPPLTAQQAAELYGALLLDQLEQLSTLEIAERYLAYTPENGDTVLRQLGNGIFLFLPQRGADLGARMGNLCTDLGQRGHHNIVIIGSDLPGLPMEYLRDAFARLSSGATRVVLGPSRDGGYYLVGMNQVTPELFTNMTWSHERVLADTLERLTQLGLSYSLLPSWFDLDTVEDLKNLNGRLEPAERARLGRTFSYLKMLGLVAASEV